MPTPALSRVTRAYVSGSNRARVHVGTVQRQEKRTVTADFTGLLPTSDPIASVTWRCNTPWIVSMSGAAISGRTVSVLANFQSAGYAGMKASITTDSGAIYSQLFQFMVRDCPAFDSETAPTTGVTSLTVAA